MNKDFVPYQQSLDIKELGFNEPCLCYFDSRLEQKFGNFDFTGINGYNESVSILSPAYSQAFRWFREKHDLMFQIFYLRNGNYAAIIHKTNPEYMDLVDQVKPSSGCVDQVVDCYSYEEAELACLIKLIEIIKKQTNEYKS